MLPNLQVSVFLTDMFDVLVPERSRVWRVRPSQFPQNLLAAFLTSPSLRASNLPLLTPVPR